MNKAVKYLSLHGEPLCSPCLTYFINSSETERERERKWWGVRGDVLVQPNPPAGHGVASRRVVLSSTSLALPRLAYTVCSHRIPREFLLITGVRVFTQCVCSRQHANFQHNIAHPNPPFNFVLLVWIPTDIIHELIINNQVDG